MQLVIVKDYFEMSKTASHMVINEINKRKSPVLALPTGDTPINMYKELVLAYKKDLLDFSKVTVFNLDEYLGLSHDHWGSYAFFMHNRLFSKVNILKENCFIPNGLARNTKKECEKYEAEIEKAGGIDLAVLGIGINGHIGFNEPGTLFNTKTHLTSLSQDTIENNLHNFSNQKEIPKSAITMGIGTIMKAKQIILLASGPHKAEAISRLFNDPVSTKFPASILQTHANVTVIVDEMAATGLKNTGYNDKTFCDFTIYDEQSLPKNKNILIFSPHPDDSSISAGGTITLLAHNNKVEIIVMTEGHRAFIPGLTKAEKIKQRVIEAKNEAKQLGVACTCLSLSFYDKGKINKPDIKTILNILKKKKPDIIFLAPREDHHPTHRQSTEIIMSALKEYQKDKVNIMELWHFETPWSMFSPGEFNTVVGLSKKVIQNKVKAIKMHKSQIERTPFDKVSQAMALMRAAVVPEQILGTYGQVPSKFASFAEIFSIKRFNPSKGFVESVSGIRGIFGMDLTEEIAEAYAYSYGLWLGKKIKQTPKVALGRDTRPSGKLLIKAVIKGLEKAKCHIYNIDIATTPLLQFEVKNQHCDGGVIITASHNEPDWNGLKFFWKDGRILKQEYMGEVIEHFHLGQDNKDKEKEEITFSDDYIDYVLDHLGTKIVNKIRKAKLKIVVDPNGGAMIVVIKKIFRAIGIETVELNMDLGVFGHQVEPTKEALKHLGPIIRQHKAHLGVGWDCDGDRVEIILPNGHFISGHYILALVVDSILKKIRLGKGSVVTSCATSQVVYDVAKKYNAHFLETDVGEANVMEKIQEIGAHVGGEGSCGGGIIPPSSGRDGILTLFEILGLTVSRNKKLSEILKSYPSYFTVNKNIKINKNVFKKLEESIKKNYKNFEIKKFGQTSIKVYFPDHSFVLFRISKTETSILRIIVDSMSMERSNNIIQEAIGLIS